VADRDSARRVEKPWGHELIWAHTERYVGKLLVIETGKRLSLQKHLKKDESIYVLRGRLRLVLQDGAGVLQEIHRFVALERVELMEVSTPELDDVVRIADDFGREGTSQA
jgi:quercetin dioxygenase-like cupin family protein